MATLSTVTTALERAWSSIRTMYPLVRPAAMVVYLHPRGDRKGHYLEKGWTTRNNGKLDEVHISSHLLHEGGKAVFTTLLHEAVHSANATTCTQDTSRQGRYHNTAFKLMAEQMGLIPIPVDGFGYAATELKPETGNVFASCITDLDESIELWQGLRVPEPGTKGKQKGRVKLTCPSCGRIIYASEKTISQGPIGCIPCEVEFIAEQQEQEP